MLNQSNESSIVDTQLQYRENRSPEKSAPNPLLKSSNFYSRSSIQEGRISKTNLKQNEKTLGGTILSPLTVPQEREFGLFLSIFFSYMSQCQNSSNFERSIRKNMN